jgi:hypothetical protein
VKTCTSLICGCSEGGLTGKTSVPRYTRYYGADKALHCIPRMNDARIALEVILLIMMRPIDHEHQI